LLYDCINQLIQGGITLEWKIETDRPVYLQLVEQIKLRIISGIYKTGDRLPAVRELAAEASVNPNTMQKAFNELEGGGLVVTMRTAGRYITENKDIIEKTRIDIITEYADNFLKKMELYGYSKSDVINILKGRNTDV
jgi:DNA-binding transcriptional regulator YhcF (GntR family)